MSGSAKYLTQEELSSFFKKIKSRRDLAMFNLIYKYGLRASELGMLKIEDVDFDRRKIRIYRRKNGLNGEYLLFSDTARLLKSYLEERSSKNDYSSILFMSQKKNPVSRKQLHYLFGYYAAKAKVPLDKRHVHCLRHSIAVHMLDSGQSLELVQDLLGHRDIKSTTIYAKISNKRRSEYLNLMERSREIVKL